MASDPRVDVQNHVILCQSHFRLDQYSLRFRRFDGDWSPVVSREVFERGHAAALLPYDPIRDEIVLIEQFRAGAMAAGCNPWLYEIVAGVIDAGETPQDVAHREGLEETGLKIQFSKLIYDYLASPGGSSENCHVYIGCVDASNTPEFAGLTEESEDIRIHVLPAADAFVLLNNNKINNAVSIIALQWLEHRHQTLRRDWQQRLEQSS
jgi:ADP-ribose pyrophosphatase